MHKGQWLPPQAAGVSTSAEHLIPLPRDSDRNGRFNPLWKTAHASKLKSQISGRGVEGSQNTEHEGELGESMEDVLT